MQGLQYRYYVNDNRYHGLRLSPQQLKGYLLIAADFSISEQEVKDLVDNDVAVLSTDHHDIQNKAIDYTGSTAEGIVINNQYIFEPEDNRYNSGAGVFYELICELYPEFKTDVRDALVGITLLSDIRPLENPKAKYYLKKLFNADVNDEYLGYLIRSTNTSDFGFGAVKLDRNYVDFTLSPKINSMLRFNKTKESVAFILGYGLKADDYKDKQKSFIKVMLERALYLQLPHIHIIVFDVKNFEDWSEADITNFVGYAVSRHKDSNGNISSFGFCISGGTVTRGSFRGRYSDLSYVRTFKNLGLDVHGHSNAFGLHSFTPSKELWQELNDAVADLEANHKLTETILPVTNLSIFNVQRGREVAENNCYVRGMYRTYLDYNGTNVKIVKQNFIFEEFSSEDYASNRLPDKLVKGTKYKYVMGLNGKPQCSYIEYSIDGRPVKSFGTYLEDGLLLPMLDKGYIVYYVHAKIT